ncbi:MAG: AAA family ATPase [Firmicutes bacterium]|nr:AAA family ATPase [Bacillota bacterium]
MFKKIELYGFKSFADRLEVDFSSGVTCIVGPNGCGKSNVSDAIRWVLGEQSSKALRGSNMQDVIFKGTDARKPISYCQVSLFFDNKDKIFPIDYEEVVISRKLYRSGESEYLLNKNTVRLKDITAMLHGSGIDRDGMTLIGQGQVAEIINSKPDARRDIFEEAAGVSHAKSRKVEALRKFERVDNELTRVRDVIHEIERTLGPLKRQAETAARYVELRDRLKTLEINVYIYSYDSSATTKERLSTELNEISYQIQASQDEIEEHANGIARAMEQLSSIDANAEELREQVLALSLRLERYSGDQRLAMEKVHRKQEVQSQLDDLKHRIQFETNNLDTGKKLLESLKKDLVEAAKKLNEMQGEYARKVQNARTLFELQAKREKVIARRETIQQLIESGQGYKFSVKKIIEQKDTNNTIAQNIIGVIAKEINVPTHLEMAIEVALGAAAQNIITKDENNAKNMIELLRQKDWGRATFLPLASVKPRLFSDAERMDLEYNYVVGIASELITYNPKISPAISSLLGRVVVVDNIGNGIELARNTRYAFKIVTLDGDVIETRGAITGGSRGKVNTLWHNQSLEEIESDLVVVNKEIDAIQSDSNAQESQEELTKYKIRVVSLENEIGAIERSMSGGSESLDLLNNSLKEKTAQLGYLSGGIEQSGNEELYNQSVVALEEAKQELVNFDANKDELRVYISSAEEGRTQAQEKLTGLHEAYYKTQSQLERVEIELEQMQERVYEEYGMTYSSCYPFRVEGFDVETSKPEIGELRRAISRLGPVNLDALEQSKEAMERHDSYATQVSDLESAKADLIKVIDDLSNEMENKFRTTFEEINNNFGVVFKELFGGGRARLELTPIIMSEGAKPKIDWLNSGIEIIAEPPGKKLQSLSLLSGGEKALTAIAILFSILKLKPMPFCLLDEIEAALDEANVSRFANYLGKFSQSTQFIVITHRKPTMELADHLYGVTMEEKGVSKLVSVKLEEYA